MSSKKILLILGHPNSDSFCHSLAKSFSEDLFLKEITSFYNSDLNKRSKNMFNDIHKDAASRIANEIKQN